MPTSPPDVAQSGAAPSGAGLPAVGPSAGPRLSQAFVVMAKPVGPVCNLACPYCYYLNKGELFGQGEQYRMSDEVLEAFVASFIGASPGPVVHFVWHGGEPTLAGISFYRRAIELQRRYLPEGWECLNSIQTNGTLLGEKWCAFLAAQRFAVGISIDGPSTFHDALRVDRHGRPSHSRAMRAFRCLRDHGLDPDVLCTVNVTTAQAPLEVYRYFLDQGVRWVQFIPVVERAPDGGPSPTSVGPQPFGEFLCRIFDEWVRHDIGRLDVQNFLEALLVVTGQPANLCVMAETCGHALAMEHDGSVYSCDHFVDAGHHLGDVRRDGLARLVGSERQLAFGGAKRDTLPEHCRQCAVLALCNGGCPKQRLVQAPGQGPVDDVGAPGTNYLCGGYRTFYLHALPYLQRMAALAHAGRRVSSIMAQLEAEEHEDRLRWLTAGRNDMCPCGSGRKYKVCCLSKLRH